MKKTVLSIIALFGISTIGNAQTFEWANQTEGTDLALVEAISSNGSNIYTTGYFKGAIDLDPGAAVNNSTSKGSHDVFIKKMDQNGNLLWAKTLGGNGSDLGREINDYGARIIISGTFSDTVDFDPGTGVEERISKGDRDVFILALDQNGDFLWVKTIGGLFNENIGGQELDSSDDLVISGGFSDSIVVDVNGSLETFYSVNNSDIFVLKMDLVTAEIKWFKAMGGTGDNAGIDLVIKANKNILLTNRFKNNLDANPDTGASAVFNLSSQAGHNTCLIELTELGDFVNAFAFENTSDMEPYDIEIDSDENIYITGYFKSTTDFDFKSGVTNISTNGDQDCFVVKMNSSKDLIWAKTFGGSDVDQSLGLEIGANGAVYTIGRFKSTVDFDPGAGEENRTASSSSFDIFVHKLNAAGDFELVFTYGDTENDAVKGLELDIMGNLYVSGGFKGEIDFDPFASTSTLTAPSPTMSGFLLTFYDASTAGIEKQSAISSFLIYPNPVQNQLFIESSDNQITELVIFDVTGKVVKSIAHNTNSIDVSDLNQGVYILKVATDKGVSTQRFVKQ